jgi:hypothetical protein
MFTKALYQYTRLLSRNAQQNGSPAADSGKTTTLKTNFAGKVSLRTHAKGGQVEPMLGDHPTKRTDPASLLNLESTTP